MTTPKRDADVLRLGGRSWLAATDSGMSIYTEIAGQQIELGGVPLDVLLRFLGPSCGILPADWEQEGPNAKPKVAGPVCVGGPYDGRRVPLALHPMKRFLVPVTYPLEIRAPWPGSSESTPFVGYNVGVYDLVPFHGADCAGTFAERELWWWTPPKEPRPA